MRSILLSLLLHIVAISLLLYWVSTMEFGSAAYATNTETSRDIILRISEMEKKEKALKADNEEDEEEDEPEEEKKEPKGFVKTSSDQEENIADEPDYIAQRDTTVSGDSSEPDKEEGENAPNIESEEDTDRTVFEQDYQDGDMEYDGKIEQDQAQEPSPIPPVDPVLPTDPLVPVDPALQPSQTPTPTPPAEPTDAVPPVEQEEAAETTEPDEQPEQQVEPTESEVPAEERPEESESVEPIDPVDPVEHLEVIEPDEPTDSIEPTESEELLEIEQPEETEDRINEYNLDEMGELPDDSVFDIPEIPSFSEMEKETSPFIEVAVTPPTTAYDPAFTPSAQPGFRTVEKKNRTTGRFVFGDKASFNAKATPLGRYQQLIYRRVAYFWYRGCDEHRGDIIPGTLIIRLIIDANGRITSMELMSRRGASVSQQSFTFDAIRSASIPPIPSDAREELIGDKMDLVFEFNFN